jgi:hypothetical protein
MNIMALVTFAVANPLYLIAQPPNVVVQEHRVVLNQEQREPGLNWAQPAEQHASRAERAASSPSASVVNLSQVRMQRNVQGNLAKQSTGSGRSGGGSEERGSGRLSLVEPGEAPRKTPAKTAKVQPTKSVPFRLIAIGSRESIMENIKILHHLGYAETIQWSNLQRGGKPGEFISILTVRGVRGV